MLLFIVFEVLFVTFFVFAVKDNVLITENDCTTIVGYVDEAYYFPTDRLIVTVDSKQYYLSGRYTNKIVPIGSIASQVEGRNVEILVKKTRNFPYFNNKQNTMIVSLRCGSDIYCELENYNNESRSNITAVLIVLPIFWIIGTGVFGIAVLVFKPEKK